MSDGSVGDVAIAAAWNVQGPPSGERFAVAFVELFGLPLPAAANSTARNDDRLALWLGPRSWLVLSLRSDSCLDAFTAKRDLLNAAGGALFDVSASRVAFRVAGAHAQAVLASGCPLDFHPRVFVSGTCAQSLWGHVNALFYKENDTPSFIVLVARSFARDVRHALDESLAFRNSS